MLSVPVPLKVWSQQEMVSRTKQPPATTWARRGEEEHWLGFLRRATEQADSYMAFQYHLNSRVSPNLQLQQNTGASGILYLCPEGPSNSQASPSFCLSTVTLATRLNFVD